MNNEMVLGATYNIVNNRLSLYTNGKLDEAEYKVIKSLRMAYWFGSERWSGIWTPAREDFIIRMAGEIENVVEFDDLEARVERYQKYAERNERDAEYAAERIANANTDRQLRQAEGTQERTLDAARHWQQRIAGAIRHAEKKDNLTTIINRIKGIEKDQRKHTKNKDESQKWLTNWNKIPLKKKDGTYASMQESAAYLANHDPGHCSMCFMKSEYPKSTYEGMQSIWSALDKEIITPEDAQKRMIKNHTRAIIFADRWLSHLAIRHAYESAYLVSVGGSLENLKPAARRKSVAPADELKKGDRVQFGYGARYLEGEIVSLHAKTARVSHPDAARYPKGYQVGRRFIKPLEGVKSV